MEIWKIWDRGGFMLVRMGLGTAVGVPASRLRLLALAATAAFVCCGFTLATAGAAWASEPTIYTATESVPVPPASTFAGSGGGDGWAVGLTSDRVYNVFHHSGSTTVNCHNQSDSSTCWSEPKTITDGSGNNFSTSIAPGLYVDQNTGHLYVSAVRTSDNVAGVLCIDTTQPDNAPGSALYCGFTALTPAGEGSDGAASANGLSDPVQVGSDWYFMDEVPGVPVGAEDQMLCFDLSTQAACANQPYPVDLGGAQYGGMSYSYPIGAAGSDIFVQVVGSTSKLACFDTNNPTVGTCGGSWPVSVSGGDGAPYPLLDGSGNVQGVCDPLGTIACFDLSGASAATPAGMDSAINGTYQYNGPAVVIGPRVYVPEANNDEVGCYDYSTAAGCSNFPKTFQNLGLLYTVNPDPQRPTCIWVNSDDGSEQIQNFDAYTGGSCGQGPVRALVSQFVGAGSSCTPSTYSSLQITSPANPSGTVQFADGDGNIIPGSPTEQIGPNGMVDLSGVNLNTSNGLPQFLISLNNGASASALTMVLTWTAPYVASCASDSDGDTSASNPTITATGTSITATAGQSFTKTVASFSDPDTAAKPSDYSASINWGDGSTSVGTISGTASKFTVTGTHTYAKAGSYSVTVSIIDKDGSGNNATVTDPAKVAAGATIAVKAKKVKRGNARLSGVPAACVRHAIRARVTGVQIASVTFALDGRRMHTRTIRSGRTYVATLAVSKGGHRVTVTVHFKKSSRTAARRFARIVSACTLPTFTG
jgi:hypothetical protein